MRLVEVGFRGRIEGLNAEDQLSSLTRLLVRRLGKGRKVLGVDVRPGREVSALDSTTIVELPSDTKNLETVSDVLQARGHSGVSLESQRRKSEL